MRRLVVYEFRIFVPNCRLIFISLDNAYRALGYFPARMRERNASDEIAWVLARFLENKRKHSAHRRLSPCAGNNYRFLFYNELFDCFGKGKDGNVFFARILQLWIRFACSRSASDDKIWRTHFFGVETGIKGD